MRNRFSGPTITVVIAAAALGSGIVGSLDRAPAQVQGGALKTPWGEPDLQGIWTVE